MKFHRLRGSMTALSALVGAGAIAALTATAVPHPGTDVDASTTHATPVPATATWTAPPSAPQTPFAAPAVVAVPCPPRQVFPCGA